jgi:hypothetical protein
VETIRAAVRHLTATRGFQGPVTPELLNQHPPVFSSSLKAYDELIGDPFARDPDFAGRQTLPSPVSARRS